MGNCHFPSPTQVPDTVIDQKLRSSYLDRYYLKSGVILGAKSSGKTTILKQLELINNCNGNDELFISMYRHILNSIRNDCVSTAIKHCSQINDLNTIHTLKTLSIDDCNQLTQIKYKIKSIGQMNCDKNMQYYLNRIDEIMDNEYKITVKDIIMHSTVSGIEEVQFEIKENKFQFIDIGSNPFNLKSYIHIFDNVNIVIYVLSLSDYCTDIITTDGTVMNAMLYSLQQFYEIIKTKKLRRSEWLLFMNKDDIFRHKLKEGISLSVCFGHKWNGNDFINPNIPLIVSYISRNNLKYQIPTDIIHLLCKYTRIKCIDKNGNEIDQNEYFDFCYEDAIKFIQDQFVDKWSEIIPENVVQEYPWMKQPLYCHVLTSTDTDTVQKVFWDVQGVIIRSNLKRGGLMRR